LFDYSEQPSTASAAAAAFIVVLFDLRFASILLSPLIPLAVFYTLGDGARLVLINAVDGVKVSFFAWLTAEAQMSPRADSDLCTC
jgi:hypothetical protein